MLIPTEMERAVELLAGIALIGVGVTVVRDARALAAVALIGLGLAWIGAGVAALREGYVLAGVAAIGLGLAA